jgi:hypothetical protein
MKMRKAPATRNAVTIPDVSVREMVRWAAPKNLSASGSPLNACERVEAAGCANRKDGMAR